MFETLKTRIAHLIGAPAQHVRDDDYRLATAVLLVRAATGNNGLLADRRARLHELIKGGFALDETAASRLIAQAIEADLHAVDLYQFTSRITSSVDDEGRRRIVEMIWEVIYAGGRVGDFEQNFVWRVADLLNVSARERVELRRRVAARATPDGDAPMQSRAWSSVAST
jgi:uncharacterized tellurite resistance protein B-like protein